MDEKKAEDKATARTDDGEVSRRKWISNMVRDKVGAFLAGWPLEEDPPEAKAQHLPPESVDPDDVAAVVRHTLIMAASTSSTFPSECTPERVRRVCVELWTWGGKAASVDVQFTVGTVTWRQKWGYGERIDAPENRWKLLFRSVDEKWKQDDYSTLQIWIP